MATLLVSPLVESFSFSIDTLGPVVEEDTYQAAVNRVMEDREFLYQTITKDVYRLGIDFNDRYRFIRIAYNIFLIGIIVSAFMFGLCHPLF